MGVSKPPGELEAHDQRLTRRQPVPERQHRPQAPAGAQLGRHPDPDTIDAVLQHPSDVGVIDGRGSTDRLDHPLGQLGVLAHGLIEDLEGDPPRPFEVLGDEDLGHRAGPDETEDPIPVAKDAIDHVGRVVGHHWKPIVLAGFGCAVAVGGAAEGL